MGIPTTDKDRFYFPSRYLAADGDALPQQTADAGCTAGTIVDSALTEADDYWNGAIGWFDGDTTTSALQGVFFHVRDFTASSDTLTLARDLPATPAAGDTYRLVLGGKYRSSQEMFGLTVGGDQPELATVDLTNITGVTVKRASPKLGAGSVTVFYDQSEDELYLKIGSEEYGVALDVSGDVSDGAVFAADGQSYLQVDVTNGSLPVGDETDVLTLAYPDNALTPDYEGYETSDGKKIRYRLEVNKNTDSTESMVAKSVYIDKPAGTDSTVATGDSLAVTEDSCEITDASDWPSVSFWVYNSTKDDCRYAKYRGADNMVYFSAANDWTALAFDAGAAAISIGDTVEGETSEASGVVVSIQIDSGSWVGTDAAGTLILSDVSGTFQNDENLQVSSSTKAVADGADVKGLRGMTAQAWEAGDVLEIMPDIDIGLDAPSTLLFEDPDGEGVAPAGVTFSAPGDTTDALSMGDVAAGITYGVWRREWIMYRNRARADIITDTINFWS